MIALRLIAEQRSTGAFVQPLTGHVILPARGDSLIARLARSFSRVLVRETSIQ